MKKKETLYECRDAWYPEYKLRVIRDSQYTATLTVFFQNQVVYRQSLNLSYGAQYGADMMDVQLWQHICCEHVDEHLHKRNICPQPPEMRV